VQLAKHFGAEVTAVVSYGHRSNHKLGHLARSTRSYL